MQFSADDLGETTLGEYRLVFSRGRAGDEYLYHSVQIFRGPVPCSRISISRPRASHDAVLAELTRRAREWIDDYEGRASEFDPFR